MMQSYNDFIFALDRKMCLHMHFYSKNVSTHALLFEKCAYTYIFIRKLALHIHFYFHAFLYNTYRTAAKNILKLQSVIVNLH